MYAVIRTGGKQFKVFPNETIRVPRLQAEEGQQVTLAEVLLLHDDDHTVIGSPQVDGARVIAEVVAHGKGRKVLVFKMKRRKDFRRTRGHRQEYTELLIKDISTPESA
jgi:large subunit ribosomal protein L21